MNKVVNTNNSYPMTAYQAASFSCTYSSNNMTNNKNIKIIGTLGVSFLFVLWIIIIIIKSIVINGNVCI